MFYVQSAITLTLDITLIYLFYFLFILLCLFVKSCYPIFIFQQQQNLLNLLLP